MNETATDREHYIDVVAIANAAATAERERCAEVFALRCVCWQNGYRPLAIYSPGAKLRGELVKGAGKRPVTTDWLKQDPPWVVGASHRASSLALNTGLLTGEMSGLDIDVTIQDVVDQIVGRIEQTLGPTPLRARVIGGWRQPGGATLEEFDWDASAELDRLMGLSSPSLWRQSDG